MKWIASFETPSSRAPQDDEGFCFTTVVMLRSELARVSKHAEPRKTRLQAIS
jgi:hypothetical protein